MGHLTVTIKIWLRGDDFAWIGQTSPTSHLLLTKIWTRWWKMSGWIKKIKNMWTKSSFQSIQLWLNISPVWDKAIKWLISVSKMMTFGNIIGSKNATLTGQDTSVPIPISRKRWLGLANLLKPQHRSILWPRNHLINSLKMLCSRL